MSKQEQSTVSLGSLLETWIKNHSEHHNQPEYFFLWSYWPSIVGKNLARHTAPYKVDGTTLIVYVSNPTVGQSILYAMPEIKRRILEVFPQSNLDRMKTRPWMGPFPLSDLFSTPEAPKPVEPPAPLCELLGQLTRPQQEQILSQLKQIKDLDLKESLLQFWVHGMTRDQTQR